MKRLLINADAGEGAAGSELDLQLLELVDALNIAVGGHAGDPAWSRELAARAQAAGVAVHLHPSYPDRTHFGRRDLDLPWDELRAALSEQRAVLPNVAVCKFHGALYNRAAVDYRLAEHLVTWAQLEGIHTLLAPAHSALAAAASDAGLTLLREAFADRAYVSAASGAVLAPRDQAGAVHHSLDAALNQTRQIATTATVQLLDGGTHPMPCDTLCLHGDGPLAIELAAALRKLFAQAGPVLRVERGIVRVAAGPDPTRLHLGYAPGGAHDRWSQRQVNRLLGNPPQAGVAELLLQPSRLHTERDCHIVVGGCPAAISVDDRSVDPWCVLALTAGAQLRIEPAALGCRSVIGIAGGVHGDSTGLIAVAPERLTSAQPGTRRPPHQAREPWSAPLGVIRAVPGPEASPARIEALAGTWRIDPRSDGIGLRLAGAQLPGTSFDIPSSPVVDGTIQATAAGPIILLRERGTLGGYPRIARVIAIATYAELWVR